MEPRWTSPRGRARRLAGVRARQVAVAAVVGALGLAGAAGIVVAVDDASGTTGRAEPRVTSVASPAFALSSGSTTELARLPAPIPPPPPAPEPPPPPVQETVPIEPPADEYAAEPAIVLGTIEIPRLGLSVPLNQGITLTTIDRGPSHWPGTALPGGAGNVVVAGHRVTKTRPFVDIHTLVPGDEIAFTVDGVRSVYAVNGNEVVTPDAMRIVDPTATPTVTLFACHPPGSARYRYVVTGDLVATA